MPTLEWLTRAEDVTAAGKVAYRLLEPDGSLSEGPADSGNMLIQGDNLEALKSLLPYYRGAVKCIYIDPPYNTRSAFEHYDDNLEHSQWLAMIYPRLVLLRELLAEDGSIWVSIDDNEGHYLKVVMDEVFGRRNFVSTIIWRKNYSPKSTAKHLSEDHDYVSVYARHSDIWRPNMMPRSEKQDKAYKNPDHDPRGPWKTSDLSARNYYSRGTYPVTTPTGRIVSGPPTGRYWAISAESFDALAKDNRIWWGRDGNAIPQQKRFLSEVRQGVVPQTFWDFDEVGHTQDAKKEVVALFGIDVFGTPKPERLIQRILHIATNPGDLVLDSFLGSGTTAAVAHKMGRRWIGIEMGDHAVTHCAPRLAKVIGGEQGGISQAVGWQGGGGFTFYRLGEPVFDADGKVTAGIGYASLAAHVWFSEVGLPLPEGGTARSGASSFVTPDLIRGPASFPAGETEEAGSRLGGRDDEEGEGPLHPSPAADRAPPRAGEDFSPPFLGVHDGRGYALLYNGVLGDRRPDGGNVLTTATLATIRAAGAGFAGPITVYGEATRLGAARLLAEGVTFKQTPYDVRAR